MRQTRNTGWAAAPTRALVCALLVSGAIAVPYASADEPQIATLEQEAKRSGDANSAKKLGRAYLEANKLPEAARVFEELSDKFPADAEAHYLYGEALMGQRKFAEAAIETKRAANLDASKPTYTLRTGEALLAAGKYDELTELTTAALNKNPDQDTRSTLEWLAKMASARKSQVVTPKKGPNRS